MEAETWKTVAEKTDTEDLISHRVNTTLDDTAIQSKGSPSTFVLRYFLFFFLVHTTCLATLAWGAQPLASMCLCMMYGFLLVSRSETMLRLGLGFATNMYIMVWYVATTLQNCCVDGAVPSSKIPFVAGKILAASIAWGLAAGFRVGLIPGMASGLSLIQLASTTVYTRSTIDAICPGSVDMLLFKNFSFASLLYWLAINISSFVIFILVNKRHNKLVLYIVLGFCVLTYYDHLQMDATLLKVNVLFPLFVMVSWPVTLHTISWTRSLGPKQKPAGLQKTDLINTTVQSFLPGIVVGACCGLYIMEGKIKLDTPNDFFECVAIPVLIFLLSRSCAINQYFSPSLYNNQKTCSGNNKKLHKCFKLLVRDFAGQMVYHCIHQPFLPRYGIFLCVFSWRRAKDCSLNFAEGGQQDGTDLCLQEILFWLKNISMHKTHPNARAGNSAKTSNILDNEDIKSIFLVATHADFESCGLSDLEKEKIMVYYKREIRKHTDVYTSMEFRVSATGEISVESSRDGVRDAGISTLKASLLHTAQRVIEHCFPEPVPIYFWCWLKQKRDRCSETLSPPCELLTESDINMDSRYMSVYPNSTFLNMINMFCDIGELFLVRNSDREGYTNDYYIFFDLQFLIDFMKDIITIDETKRSDALNSQEWDLLDQQGKGSLTLLEHHLSRFYKNRNMGQKYSYMRLDRQPLVQSMLQLDFMFIVGKDFYIPQLLPKYDDQCRQSPDFFRDVDELLWEYVFDFQEFDFHHEYVFFRLLAKCVNDYHCEMRQVYRNWASIYQTTDQAQPQPAATVMSQWFTISCEQRNKDGGQYNRIYLRASKDYGKQQSLTFLQHIAGIISYLCRKSGTMMVRYFHYENITIAHVHFT